MKKAPVTTLGEVFVLYVRIAFRSAYVPDAKTELEERSPEVKRAEIDCYSRDIKSRKPRGET